MPEDAFTILDHTNASSRLPLTRAPLLVPTLVAFLVVLEKYTTVRFLVLAELKELDVYK